MRYAQSLSRMFLAGVLVTTLVVGATTAPAQAEETLSDTEITSLLERIKELQAQLKALQEQQSALRAEIREVVELTRTLATGMSGEDVRALQELLASDPEIYPEGLVTGYFGSMTEKAVKKLQKRFGIEQVGTVGPLTRGTINKLFKHSGKGKKSAFDVVLLDDDEKDDDDIDLSEYTPGTTGVLVCHAPGGNTSKAKTVAIGGPAVQAHLAHGDTLGSCDGDDRDDGSDKDDDDKDDADEEVDEDDAEDALEDARDAIADATEAIEEAEEDDLDTEDAEELLAMAEELLDDAEQAYEDEDYEEAERIANKAEQKAESAEDAIEDDESEE